MHILKQSTAVTVKIGPFVDILDGAAAETGETPSVKLSKNGAALAAKSEGTTPGHDADGYYNCALNGTDTETPGTLVLTVAASATALPVRHEFQVVEEAIYNDLFASGAAGLAKAAALTTVDNEVGAIQTDLSNATDGLGAIKTAVDSNGTAIAALNDISTADVNAQCAAALTTYGALKPTVAGRTLDVGTGGEAGVDFNNIAGTLGASNFAAGAIDSTVLNANAIAAIATDVVTEIVEPAGNITLRESLAYIMSYAAGITTGAATTSPVYKTHDDTLSRITATTDGAGNRSVITLATITYS
jgi:hypothetical protein